MIDSFWGEYRFLSNFYSSEVEYEGIVYPTVEHAFQAAKTLDEIIRQVIANLPTPKEAKRAGRRVDLRTNWEGMKTSVMKELVTKKFNDNRLKQMLLDTREEELVEGNTWGDKCWGICNGVGENRLGKILMEVRSNVQ